MLIIEFREKVEYKGFLFFSSSTVTSLSHPSICYLAFCPSVTTQLFLKSDLLSHCYKLNGWVKKHRLAARIVLPWLARIQMDFQLNVLSQDIIKSLELDLSWS